MKRRFLALQTLILLGFIGVSIPLVLGFLGAWHPAFDSMAHFRAHLAVALMAGAAILFFTLFRAPALLGFVLGAAAFTTTLDAGLLPGLGPVQAALAPKDENQPVYRLLQLNLRYNNTEPEKVLSLVGRAQPDVMTFDEMSAMWREKLQPLLALYPHHVFCPYPNRKFGVAILSRRPFAVGSAPQCHDHGSFAVAKVDLGGRTAEIAALHLGWPWPFGQESQIDRIEEPLSRLEEPALLAGDFNAAFWSQTVRRVAEIGGLSRVPAGGATWLYRRAPEFLRFAGLHIDHVLAKGGILVHAAGTLEPVGSDHLPILVEFSLVDGKPAQPDTATVSLPARVPAT